MANVIDIVIRATNQAAGPLRDVERQAGAVNDRLGTMVGRIGSVITPTLILSTAIAGVAVAAYNMAKGLGDTIERLDQVSARTGLSIEAVQVYQRILEEAGVSAGSLTVGMTFLSRAIATNNPILVKLGITTRDTGVAFQQLIGILANAKDETVRNQAAFELLGRGSGDLVANAVALSKGFDAMRDSMKEMGGLITSETAPALRELDSAMDELDRNWKSAWQNMKLSSVPAAKFIVQAINHEFAKIRWIASLFGMGGGGGRGAPIQVEGIEVSAKRVDSDKLLADALKKNAASTDFLSLELSKLNSASISELGTITPGMPGSGGPAPDAGPGVASERTHQILGDWRSLVAEITSSAAILDETLNSLFNGLTSGFQQVFAGLLGSAQTFGSAMKTLFRALVDEILAQLARIVAAKVFSFILNLLGLGVVSAGVSAAGGGGGNVGGTSGGAGPNIASAGPIVHIHAIDERSFAEHFRSLGGSVRVTERRLAEAGEW